MKPGSLIRRVFPRQAWPYPKGERQVRQVILVSLLTVFVGIACVVAWLKYSDDKTLDSRDVYYEAKNMTSYSSEAYLIAAKSQQQPIVGPYRQVYVQQLASDVSDVKDKLTTHEVTRNIQPRVARLVDICDQLSDTLDTFSRKQSDQAYAAHVKELKRLANESQAIEESL